MYIDNHNINILIYTLYIYIYINNNYVFFVLLRTTVLPFFPRLLYANSFYRTENENVYPLYFNNHNINVFYYISAWLSPHALSLPHIRLLLKIDKKKKSAS